MIQFQEYLQSDYPGFASFIDTIINPIFGGNFKPDHDYDDMVNYPDELEDFDEIEKSHDEELKKKAEDSGLERILKLGTIKFQGDTRLIYVFDITVSERRQLSRNRKGIQQLISRILTNQSGAFMLFHYEDAKWEWRFSYKFVGKDQNDSTNSKRFTYLFGKNQVCKTAAQRFTNLLNKKCEIAIDDITEAFSVEALSKEFFNTYKSHYEHFCQFVYDNKNDSNYFGEEFSTWEDKTIRDYVKKLLGRIVFLHFLQKKGWLGVSGDKQWGEGDLKFMINLYDSCSNEHKANYLDDVLEPLFEDLNTQRIDDLAGKWSQSYAIAEEKNGIKIPYLNGGLFEREATDTPMSVFPADYFANLLDFFNQYNFTIDENDPNDAEVGIDPEMLGRIFENLLEDNRDKGAFYTPKEIVQYMCRESLIAYLQTDVEEESKDSLRKFVTTHEVAELRPADVFKVDKKLREVKICDPAIGSGAFPMGLLKELFDCRMAIEGSDEVKTPSVIKKDIIQNSIFGVDIEKGAVDIARLRFWLSLVIDEQTPHALPNMDFKIMQGNSLLEQYKGVKLDDIYDSSRQMMLAFDEETQARMLLKEHMQSYFEKENHKEKTLLLKKIDVAVKSLVKAKTLGNPEVSASIDALNLRNNQAFFLWHTWFNDVLEDKRDSIGKTIKGSGGFDIVIGNPPYIQLQNMKEMSAIYKESNYVTYNKSADIYCLFTEQGFNLLKQNGILCYIMPNKWMQAAYGQQLRTFLSKKRIYNIVDFGDVQIFENATTYTCILLMANNKSSDTFTASYLKEFDMSAIEEQVNVFTTSDFGKDTWVLSSSKELSLINKIKKSFPNLKKYCNGEAYRGILTGLSEAFLISEETKCQLINENDSAREVIVPFLLGRDVKPYMDPKPNKYLILFKKGFTNGLIETNSSSEADAWRIMQSKYPSICNWLEQFADKGRARGDKGDYWWELRACDYYGQFEKPKIMYQAFQVKSNFVYDTDACFCNNSMWILPTENKALLGLLNSKMGWWLISKYCSQIQNGYQLIWKYFCQLPIALKKNNDDIVSLVEQILSIKQANPQADTTSLERKIDLLVYDLYGLTKDERLLIDPEYTN